MEGSEHRAGTDLRTAAAGAGIVALAASAWAWSHGLLLDYADARSHLTIARRLVDGPNRGLVQLGTVWLPLQHLLLAPLSAIDALWTSGWAGALLGSLCMAIEAAAIWHITAVLNRGSRIAGLLAAVVYVTNPTILFLHTSAFAEPVLYASVLTATAGLVHWAAREKPWSGGEMALYCGAPTALAVLARYDGWAFAAAAAVCVAVLSWRRWGSGRYAMKLALCFGAPSAVAAAWWMWFNWVNFGDPLEFQRGRYSAQAQQDVLARQGKLPDKGDLGHAIGTFTHAAWSALGWITLLAAVAGVVVIAVRLRNDRVSNPAVASDRSVLTLVVVVLAVAPALFYTWSLFSGQVALRFGTSPSESTFNLRYGAAVVPGLAVLAATALAALDGPALWRRSGTVVLALVPFVALAVVPGWQEVGVVREGREQREAGADQWDAANWLNRRIGNDTVLIDDSVNPMLPVIGTGLDHVVAPFSQDWRAQLRHPNGVEFIYVDRGNRDDQIRRAIARDPSFLRGFHLAADFGSVSIYRSSEGGHP